MVQTFSQWKSNKSEAPGGTTFKALGIPSFSQWKQENPRPEKPSLLKKIGLGIKNYANESAKAVDTFGNAILHPIDTFKKAPDVFMEPYMEGINKAAEGDVQFWEPGVSNKVAGIAKIISGTATAAFSPISGLFKIAENTPGLKQVADVVNIPFSVAGVAGSYGSGKIVDALPISSESKDILKEPIKELGSLTAQIFIGGKIMEKVGSFAEKGEITPKIAKKIVAEAKTEASTHPVMETAYEPDTSFENFKAKSTIERIQKKNAQSIRTIMENLSEHYDNADVVQIMRNLYEKDPSGEFSPREVSLEASNFKPLRRPPMLAGNVKEDAVFSPYAEKTMPVIETPRETPLAEPTSGNKASGLARSIEAKAIEAKLTEGFKDVAGYDSSTLAEQAMLSDKLIKSGIDNARSVVRGEAPLPDRLRGSALIVAMEEHLAKNPSAEIAYELANSPLVTAVSQAGSELGLMQNRVQDSITQQFREIKSAREAKIEKKAGKSVSKVKEDVVKEIKQQKVPIKKETWSSFIEEIKCNY